MSIGTLFKLIVALVAFIVFSGSIYVVSETEQVILTQFGKPLDKSVTTAGLHFKTPFVQDINRIEKRVLEWDGPTAEMPTKDKLYITVDAFGRWRIKDPLTYLLRLRDERTAQSRLDDILGSEMRNTVARHELVELIRTTKSRVAVLDATTVNASGRAAAGLPPIQLGRMALELEIAEKSRAKLADFGIELLDVRFKRINYKADVTSKIYERMISERRQIAERFRSEGAGEAAKILGSKERDLKEIESVAYRTVQGIQGKADAEATRIYAQAYNGNPEAREFYGFTRALETYRTAFSKDTTVVLTTDSGFLRFFKGDPGMAPVPAPAPVSAPVPAP
ncbi:MAG: hflC [Chthoniobacteraceae bacterium]|nr:hflC [Chthoniobacteraceae bacterium]